MDGYKRMIKVFFISLAVFITSFSQVLAATNTEDNITDGKAYLESVYQQMDKVESFNLQMAIDVRSAIITCAIASNFDYFSNENDAISKINTKIVLHSVKDQPNEIQIDQYIKKQKNKVDLYTNLDNTWSKMSVEESKKESADVIDAKTMMRFIKEVEVKDQNDDEVVLNVKINMAEMKKLVFSTTKEIFNEESKDKENNKKAQVFIEKFLNAVDDFSYIVAIDKKTKQIHSVYMDLSKPVQVGVLLAIDEMNLTEKEKIAYQLMAKDMQVILQEDISKINQVVKFDVPKSVIKSAAKTEAREKKIENAA